MIIDSGFRCQLTSFARTTAAAPSPFVARLRKYLRTRRVTSVAQVGTDRIIELQFSDGQYKLFLEFYAGGNIVLTDKELNIIALLRVVSEGDGQEELRVGLKYSLENRQNFGGVPPLTKERVREGLQRALDKTKIETIAPSRKVKKKSGDALRKALATTLTEFPPLLVDHAFRVKGFDSNTSVEEVIKDDTILDRLMEVLDEAGKVIADITASETAKGYIIATNIKPRVTVDETDSSISHSDVDLNRENLLYDDFHPFRPRQFEGIPETTILEFEGFNSTVDDFFSSIEAQKLESKLTEREEQAKKKLEAARQDHQKRVGGLQQVQELNVRKAQAIEANLQRVQEAIFAVNGLIAQGMDWVEIARLIEMEQARQNPVAGMIKLPLKLYENSATLLLLEADNADEDDFEADETGSDASDSEDEKTKSPEGLNHAKPTDKRLAVDIDLALSPWSNARQYYDQKKTAAVKEQKTLLSSATALKSTEKKISADLKKGLKQEKEVLRPVRRQNWFEKFYYFISSDGYLVLGGKDAQQNEILYKRHLKRGDVYVHADLHGAASIVIKNKTTMLDSPIPPSTLSQAGTLAVSSSSAWDSKAVMSAWWVDSDQVSKTAPTGEYLTTGSFIIKGKKNFLPPGQLLLGFGVMFHISEESKTRHLKHRLQETIPEGINNETASIDKHKEAITEPDSDSNLGPNQSDNDRNDNSTASEAKHDLEESSSDSDSEDGMDDQDGNGEKSSSQYENPLQSNSHATNAHTDTDQIKVERSKEDLPAPREAENLGNESSRSVSGGGQDSDTPIPSSGVAAAKTPTPTGTRHLSARERRLLRKGQDSLPTTPSQPSTAQVSDDEPRSKTPQSMFPEKALNPAQLPRVRGKHGQRAKQKAKYAHQDEEDRALALRLLGSTAAQEKAESEAESKAAKDAEIAAQKERRRQQHLRAQQAGKESEEIRQFNLDEGIENIDDDEAAEMGILESFVGIPLPGDEILDVLVVCGPWDAIGGRFRWRVKMQPGTMKKGKAVREILGAWAKGIADYEKRKPPTVGEAEYEEKKVLRREGELIKALKETEVVGIIPVKGCRVVISGAEKGRGTGGGGKGKRGGRGSKKK